MYGTRVQKMHMIQFKTVELIQLLIERNEGTSEFWLHKLYPSKFYAKVLDLKTGLWARKVEDWYKMFMKTGPDKHCPSISEKGVISDQVEFLLLLSEVCKMPYRDICGLVHRSRILGIIRDLCDCMALESEYGFMEQYQRELARLGIKIDIPDADSQRWSKWFGSCCPEYKSHEYHHKEEWGRLIYRGLDYGDKYLVSTWGRVKSVKTDRILSFDLDKSDYIICRLSVGGRRRKTIRVHRAVAETFIPNPDNKSEVRHLNGSRQTNSVKNLGWANKGEKLPYLSKWSF